MWIVYGQSSGLQNPKPISGELSRLYPSFEYTKITIKHDSLGHAHQLFVEIVPPPTASEGFSHKAHSLKSSSSQGGGCSHKIWQVNVSCMRISILSIILFYIFGRSTIRPVLEI